MNRFDIIFILLLAVVLIFANETGFAVKASSFIFIPMFACYLIGRWVGGRTGKPEREIKAG